MEPAYPMHEAPQQLQQQIPPQQPMQQLAYPAQYGYANPPYPQEAAPARPPYAYEPEPQYAPPRYAQNPYTAGAPYYPQHGAPAHRGQGMGMQAQRWRRLSPRCRNASATSCPSS